MIKFSILIPAFKSKFLYKAIASVLIQSYDNFEIIVVDDASPEDLHSIVSSFNDPRIQFYRNEIGFGAINVVGNWNKCLEYANGDYILCMGDDDELSERCLEEYISVIQKYPEFDCFHTRLAFIDENSKIFDIQEDRPLSESVYSAIWHTWRKGRRHVLGDWLFNIDALKKIGGFVNFPCAWGSDGITAFKLGSEKGIVNSPYVGFRYRISNMTISSNNSIFTKEKINAWCQIEKWYESLLEEKPEDNIDIIYWTYLSSHLHDRMIYNKKIELQKCIRNNKTSLFWWLKNCKEYGIPRSLIFKLAVYVVATSICKL